MNTRLTSVFLYAFLAFGSAAWAQSPQFRWATYLPGDISDVAQLVVADKDGTIWVAGYSSSNIPFTAPNDPRQAERAGGSDAFIAKYRPQAGGPAQLLFWTWLGGTGNEDVRGLAVDEQGRVYITGTTTSTDFPVMGPAFQTTSGGGRDAYVAVVEPVFPGYGSLVFSSYFGGSGEDYATSLAIAAGGWIAVTGYTTSNDLQPTSGAVQGGNRGGYEAIVFRFNILSDTPQLYSTYFGGGSSDIATSITIDRTGLIWIAGTTASEDFPITGNAYQGFRRSAVDGFVAAINPTIAGPDGHSYGTYFGGSAADYPQQLRIDANGRFWLAGYTLSTDLAVTPDAARSTFGGEVESFAFALDPAQPSESQLLYGTYVGTGNDDILYGLALLSNGRIAVSGYRMSASITSGFTDAFLTVIDPGVAGPEGIVYRTDWGGRYADAATSVSPGDDGSLFVTGWTYSPDLRVTDGSTRNTTPGLTAGFMANVQLP